MTSEEQLPEKTPNNPLLPRPKPKWLRILLWVLLCVFALLLVRELARMSAVWRAKGGW